MYWVKTMIWSDCSKFFVDGPQHLFQFLFRRQTLQQVKDTDNFLDFLRGELRPAVEGLGDVRVQVLVLQVLIQQSLLSLSRIRWLLSSQESQPASQAFTQGVHP